MTTFSNSASMQYLPFEFSLWQLLCSTPLPLSPSVYLPSLYMLVLSQPYLPTPSYSRVFFPSIILDFFLLAFVVSLRAFPVGMKVYNLYITLNFCSYLHNSRFLVVLCKILQTYNPFKCLTRHLFVTIFVL